MGFSAFTRRIASVVVEYDGAKGRESRTFERSAEARRFYLKKDGQGKNPRIVSASR